LLGQGRLGESGQAKQADGNDGLGDHGEFLTWASLVGGVEATAACAFPRGNRPAPRADVDRVSCCADQRQARPTNDFL
jgi:hypothetical protein